MYFFAECVIFCGKNTRNQTLTFNDFVYVNGIIENNSKHVHFIDKNVNFQRKMHFFKRISRYEKIINYYQILYRSIQKCSKYMNLSILSRNYVFVRDMKNCGDAEMNKLSFFYQKKHTFSTLFFVMKVMTKSMFFHKIGSFDREMFKL